ncbi:hypothetical protein EPUS_05701 [Endocarpon pusillum Z07020]|uniref:CCHC-type domain-containing protein n=1 Tax=Endocarpon pusillum (strain Z07020 / HMAS-L-300199) TaxID=1263415 RepID=U1G5Q2_ENDPU|nr:uncharacterized protein EPUS_05701 [Endocarpon pusillum Z07020]ERF72647.1 hypothetical protein EPUS_05701 [Endocarpon pusillum Z07020]
MAVSAEGNIGTTKMKLECPSEAPHVKVYLASKSSLKDRRVLVDSAVPLEALTQLSGYFRDAFPVVTEASQESLIPNIGPDQHNREASFAPAQVAHVPGGPISITIMGGDALADETFKIILRWILDTYKSGETEQISDKLSFTDLIHCMGVAELLAVPVALKDQFYQRLAKIADDQVPLDDVKALYAHATTDHPARSMVVESVGNAYLEKRLKNRNAYYEYSDENEEFKKDLQRYMAEKNTPFNISGTEPHAVTITNEAKGRDETQGTEANSMSWGPATTTTPTFASSCGNQALKPSERSYLPAPIVSFDGPADEWSPVGGVAGDQWTACAPGWQDTSAPAGGFGEDAWATTGGESTNNNGWGDDTGGGGYAATEDDNTCRRCKQSGHFARDCPEPRNDNCFNCGQPGHISRDCTEPKKPRGDDRTCRKCNEVGHIARDCPAGGAGGGDRACHKCGEVGHFSRECTSSAFGATAGGAGGGMKCYNCQQYGHKSSECINEPVEREYGSDPRTCNKCGQQGHISRDCREDGGDSYSMQHAGGGYGEEYNTGYGGGYDGQAGLYDPGAGAEANVDPPREEVVNVTVTATRVRKGKKGRPGYVDVTQMLYDPRAYEGPEPTSSYGGGGERRGGGGRGGRGGRGRGRGGRRNVGDDGGHGGDFANDPPAAEEIATVAVEGDWADAGDAGDAGIPSAPAASGW